MIYDAIVLGLGGMGSATLSQLARRGMKVLGIEQYPPVHNRGSSHGHTRIIRTAYAENPSYVPLVRRAFELWKELEKRQYTQLLTPMPCLNVGKPDGGHVRGVLDSVKLHNLQAETLTATEINKRFPAFNVANDYVGVLEQDAGYLFVEDCVRTHLDDAIATGNAEVRSEEPVINYEDINGQIRIVTRQGTYHAKKLVITGGAWAARLLSDLQVPLKVMRQVQLWFEPEQSSQFQPVHFPLYIVESPAGEFYGFPRIDGRGIKCAGHHGAPLLASPDEVDWNVHDVDELPVRNFMSKHFAPRIGNRTEAMVCMYTVTPDRHFIIDVHPHNPRVCFAAGFSGHGFKFAPTVGEILADFVEQGKTRHDINLFRASRFSQGTTS